MATVMQRDTLPTTYACDQCGREAPPRASLMELEQQGWHEAYGASYLCPDCRLHPRPFGRWESSRQQAQRAAARN
jgi:predicted RNA-binding Zn-ribbon protein involved in translation (DUF1610 family)